jgi:hypothetical protein
MSTSLPKHSPEVIALCKDIEQCIGCALQSPSDFECLIDRLWEKQHQVFSLSTIKRLWGYVGSNGQPRLSTLNTLSQFLGYADWNAYLAHLEQRSESESALFKGEGICTEDLSLNDILQVSWLPNRLCTFRYLGDNHFVVQSSKNAKLQVGDTFEAITFIIGKPMYLDKLKRQDGTITSYVAGKRNGITSVQLIVDNGF